MCACACVRARARVCVKSRQLLTIASHIFICNDSRRNILQRSTRQFHCNMPTDLTPVAARVNNLNGTSTAGLKIRKQRFLRAEYISTHGSKGSAFAFNVFKQFLIQFCERTRDIQPHRNYGHTLCILPNVSNTFVSLPPFSRSCKRH